MLLYKKKGNKSSKHIIFVKLCNYAQINIKLEKC